jgi:hypothetical protein
MLTKSTRGHAPNGVGTAHHSCAALVWRMLMRGERCRTLSLRPCLLPPEPGQGERLHQPKEFRSMKKVNFQSKNG